MEGSGLKVAPHSLTVLLPSRLKGEGSDHRNYILYDHSF